MKPTIGLWCEYPNNATAKDANHVAETTAYFKSITNFIVKNGINRLVFRLQCPEPPRRWQTAEECWEQIVKPFPLYSLDSTDPSTLSWFINQPEMKDVETWLLPYQDKWSGYSTIPHYQEPGSGPWTPATWEALAISDFKLVASLVDFFNSKQPNKKVHGIVIESENTTLQGSEEQKLSTVFSNLPPTSLLYAATGGPNVSIEHDSASPKWGPPPSCSHFFPQWYWIGAMSDYSSGNTSDLLSAIQNKVPADKSFSNANYTAMFSCEPDFFGNGKWPFSKFMGFLTEFKNSEYQTSDFMIFQANFLKDPAHWMP